MRRVASAGHMNGGLGSLKRVASAGGLRRPPSANNLQTHSRNSGGSELFDALLQAATGAGGLGMSWEIQGFFCAEKYYFSQRREMLVFQALARGSLLDRGRWAALWEGASMSRLQLLGSRARRGREWGA